MATKNSIASNIPIEISKGGTNASSFSVTYGVVYFDSSSYVTVSSLGTSGQVLTSNGPSAAPTFQSSSGSLSTAFSATLSADTSADKTGDGTEYTIICDSEEFDLGSNYNNTTGIFTAPSSGKYYLSSTAMFYLDSPATDDHSTNEYHSTIVTSNRSYKNVGNANSTGSGLAGYGDGAWYSNASKFPFVWGKNIPVFCDMDAADTAYMTGTFYGTGGKIYGFMADDTQASGASCMFNGYLVG